VTAYEQSPVSWELPSQLEDKSCERLSESLPRSAQATEKLIYLIAAGATLHSPLTEVFAVVPEHVIGILAESRTRPPDDLRSVFPFQLIGSDPDGAPEGEARQRHFLHRTPAEAARKPAVVHDAPQTDVDTVMHISLTKGHHMSAERRLLTRVKHLVARTQPATWGNTFPMLFSQGKAAHMWTVDSELTEPVNHTGSCARHSTKVCDGVEPESPSAFLLVSGSLGVPPKGVVEAGANCASAADDEMRDVG
jgi:hypothetical protein